jgi:hypothetical protein
MTVEIAEPHAHVQRLVSVVKMAIVLEGIIPKNSVPLCVFYGQNDSMQRIFTKKYFLFMLGSVCNIKQFILGGKYFADDEEVETAAKGLCAAGFDALVKPWDKCNVGVGYVDTFFLVSNITCFMFFIHL